MGLSRALVAALASVVVAAPFGIPGAAAADARFNQVQGTDERDHLTGTGEADLIRAHAGNDTIHPRAGADRIRAGRGGDTIYLTRDGRVDRVFCGPGFDVIVWDVEVDPRDVIDANCEGQIA